MKTFKIRGLILGFFLGFGAPIGSLVLHGLFGKNFSLGWLEAEINRYPIFYGYMTFATPVVFALFGYFMGLLSDRFSLQKRALQALNAVLESQSIMDDMTGLYNHRHLIDVVSNEIERAKRYHRTLAVIMLDLDNFKMVNDRYGHLVGDQVLWEAANILRNSVRKIDIVGRYGGDEFLIVLPESTLESARSVAGRIQLGIREHSFHQPEHALVLTMSAGIASPLELEGLTTTALIESADQALLKAKSLGKDKCYSEEAV